MANARTVEKIAAGKDNNFNLIRLIASYLVLISHSFALTGRPQPLSSWATMTLGSASVVVFFTISGFFITKSFVTRESTLDFAVARVVRIYPALIVVVLLSAFVLGPVMTTMPLDKYFRASATWVYAPAAVSLFGLKYNLPGVFAVNADRGIVNGSLWTLCWEVFCYVCLAVTMLLLEKRKGYIVVTFLAIMVLCVAYQFNKHLLSTVAILCLPFYLGSMAYVFRRHVPLHWGIFIALIVLTIILHNTFLVRYVLIMTLSYGALWVGALDIPVARKFNLLGDYSYGTYIYAFPIQQCVAASVVGVSAGAMILIASPAVLAMSVLSWHFVEHPALRRRHFLTGRLRPKPPRSFEASNERKATGHEQSPALQ